VPCLQRRNRPNLAAGDLVYARVAVASRDMEPELACTDASGKVVFGLLGLGFVVVSVAADMRCVCL
jgi:exosome complex component RRP40